MLFASKRWREEFDADGKIKIRQAHVILSRPRREVRHGQRPGERSRLGSVQRRGQRHMAVAMVDADGKPLGVAVIPFLNAAQASASW